MYSRQIYIYILITGLFTTSCEKLPTDSGVASPEIKSDDGLNYWGGSYHDYGHAAVQTSDGGYAVVGSQYSASSQADLILVKFSSSLEFESNTSYGGAGADSTYNNIANDLQQTEDGGYILVGNTYNGSNYDVWVVKYNSLFALTWQDTIKGAYDDFGNSVQQTQDGAYLVCGTSYDGNDEDIMLWKITPPASTDGEPSYAVLFNSEATEATDNGTRDFGNHAQQTTDGGYIIVGTSATGIKLIKLTSTGILDTGFDFDTDGISPLGKAGDEGIFVQQLTDDSYVVVGNTEGGVGAQSDVYINTVSSSGASVLTGTIGGAYNDKVESVRQTSDGGFVFTGSKYFESTQNDVWVVKLTPSLSTVWDHTYGGDLNDHGKSIDQTYDGGYIITGSTMSYGNQSEIVLLKLKSDGVIEDLIGKLNASTVE